MSTTELSHIESMDQTHKLHALYGIGSLLPHYITSTLDIHDSAYDIESQQKPVYF